MYNKIVYQKYGKKDLPKAIENINLSDGDDEISDSQPLTEEEINDLMLFFRTCIVRRDKEILKEKLTKTIEYREQQIKKKGVKFFELFPFYFIDVDLVCLEQFKISFDMYGIS